MLAYLKTTKHKFKKVLFSLLFCGGLTLSPFLSSAYSQISKEQAKISFYESMIRDENVLSQEKAPLYDTLIMLYQDIPDIDKVHYYLLEKMNFYYDEGEYLESYKIGLKMIEMFDGDTNCDSSERYLVHLIIAKSCRNLGMFKDSMSSLYTIIQDGNNPYVIEAHAYLGMVFMQMEQMEQSWYYNNLAVELLGKADSITAKKAASVVYNTIAGYHYTTNKLDSALYYLNLSIDYFDFRDNESNKSYRYHNMAIIYQEMGEMSMAEYYLRKAIEISKNEPYNMARYLQNMAYLLFQSNRLSDAENYYLQALAIAEEANIKQVKSSVLIELSDLYHKKNLHRQAWQYLREGVELRDSIFSIENMEKISLISQQFENYKITSEKELLEKELQLANLSSQKKNIIVSVLVFLLLIITALTFFLIHRIKKRTLLNIENETKSAERSIRKEFENTLEGKNRELASNALYMMKANEILTSLEQSIKQLNVIKDSTKRNEIIKEMATVIKSYNAGQGWDEFKLYFEQVQPSFYSNLNKINPNLSKIEQRLSALLVLNMSTKEIASVTNRSIRTVETLIYRLRKNLNVPADEKTTSYLRKLLDADETVNHFSDKI